MGNVVVVSIAVLVAIGLLVVVRSIGDRKGQWERIWIEEDRWKVVNRTGDDALEVRIEVRGHGIRGVDTGDVGDVEDGASVEFLTAVDLQTTGGDPLVAVTWQAPGSGRRRMWAAPLRS